MHIINIDDLRIHIQCTSQSEFNCSSVVRFTKNKKIRRNQNKIPVHMSRVMKKPDFRLCENKGAIQLRSNWEADQRLCFH